MLGLHCSQPIVTYGGYKSRAADVFLTGDEKVDDEAFSSSQLHKRDLTFALFVDNLIVQPQLFVGLGGQLYSVG